LGKENVGPESRIPTDIKGPTKQTEITEILQEKVKENIKPRRPHKNSQDRPERVQKSSKLIFKNRILSKMDNNEDIVEKLNSKSKSKPTTQNNNENQNTSTKNDSTEIERMDLNINKEKPILKDNNESKTGIDAETETKVLNEKIPKNDSFLRTETSTVYEATKDNKMNEQTDLKQDNVLNRYPQEYNKKFESLQIDLEN